MKIFKTNKVDIKNQFNIHYGSLVPKRGVLNQNLMFFRFNLLTYFVYNYENETLYISDSLKNPLLEKFKLSEDDFKKEITSFIGDCYKLKIKKSEYGIYGITQYTK